MSIIAITRPTIKPTRRAPRPNRPFGEGIDPHATTSVLSDDEQRVIDELSGDWPPADARLDEDSDPAGWGPWADAFRYEPTAEDARWWAAESSTLASERHAGPAVGRPRDVVSASMIDPTLARALASGRLTEA